jgi:hypothetical protein
MKWKALEAVENIIIFIQKRGKAQLIFKGYLNFFLNILFSLAYITKILKLNKRNHKIEKYKN